MKTPLRLIFLALLVLITMLLFVRPHFLEPYTTGSTLFTKRLYDWQLRFNHSATSADWAEVQRKGSLAKAEQQEEETMLRGGFEKVKGLGLDMDLSNGEDEKEKEKETAKEEEAKGRVQDLLEQSRLDKVEEKADEKAVVEAILKEAGASTEAPKWGALEEEEARRKANLPDKVVVMGKMWHEDTDWVAKELPDWQHAIYIVDSHNLSFSLPPNTLTTPANKGREAMAYLTYIVENYHTLPSILAFIHPHRDGYPQAWHTDATGHSNVASLSTLRLDYIKKVGYANLRCNANPGCPSEVQPYDASNTKEPSAHMKQAWEELFPPPPPSPDLFPGEDSNPNPVPHTIAAACCAQFAVSAEQVRKRPLQEYAHFRNWLLQTEMSDYVSGRVFEYLWHLMFGREAVNCPNMRECYCNVYGRRCRG